MTPFQTYAVMVLCARDADVLWGGLAAPGANPVLPAAGAAGFAYLTEAHWQPVAQLRCDDLIITKGLNCYYGLVLRCRAGFGPFQTGDFLCVLRGTMDPLEWINDALAEFPTGVPGVTGLVGKGFWDIYDSMTVNDLSGGLLGDNAAVAVAAHVKVAAGNAPAKLYVAGHSLGAALATYLTADLQKAFAGSNVDMDPYFFASPRTGTPDYATHYRSVVGAYTVVNYTADLVPNLPTIPPFQTLLGGGPTHDVHIIPLFAPNSPPFDVRNNHSPVAYARMLDSTNALARALPL